MTNEEKQGFAFWAQAAISALASAWIWIPWAWSFMGAMMIFDTITGWLAGKRAQVVSSRAGHAGLNQKAIMFLVVGAMAYIETVVLNRISFSPSEWLRGFFPLLPEISMSSAFACFYGLNELVSGIENCQRGGITIPFIGPFLQWAYKFLEQAKAQGAPKIDAADAVEGK